MKMKSINIMMEVWILKKLSEQERLTPMTTTKRN